MTDGTTTRKLNTEGADLLTLAGVNDANLIELSRLCGVKVGLRGDTLTITGAQPFVDQAAQIGTRMIDMARQRSEISPDDVLRLGDEGERGDGDGDGGTPDAARIALPGVRRVVQAKTQGQAEYLRQITENDIVVAI